MTSAAPPLVSTPRADRLPFKLKLVHAFGAVAFGVKDTGFSVFLLLYYNQVLGMDARLVSLALLLALLIDAAVDPLLGHLSDRTYTRWGKRLPWLYAAPLPLAFGWALLWSPPWGEAPSFAGLLALAVTVRVLLSACEVPSVALVPELTRDYDERTAVLRLRFLFGWSGGLVMLFLAYGVFLGEGLLDREGYLWFGVFGAGLMAASVLLSALGQHRRVAHLPARRPPPFSWRGAFGEIGEALTHRAFVILMAGGAAAYAAQGLTFSSTNYVLLYVWQLPPESLRLYPFVLFGSVLTSFVIVAPLHRILGKRASAVACAGVSATFAALPYIVRHFGGWPTEGEALSTGLLFATLFTGNAVAVVVMISISSMVADVVEAGEERTGRREEGTFYAGNFFMQKCATGLGIFLTGLMVDFAGLPEQAVPAAVGEPVRDALGLSYAGLALVMATVAILFLRRFPIDRADHEARLAALDAAARANPDASGMPP